MLCLLGSFPLRMVRCFYKFSAVVGDSIITVSFRLHLLSSDTRYYFFCPSLLWLECDFGGSWLGACFIWHQTCKPAAKLAVFDYQISLLHVCYCLSDVIHSSLVHWLFCSNSSPNCSFPSLASVAYSCFKLLQLPILDHFGALVYAGPFGIALSHRLSCRFIFFFVISIFNSGTSFPLLFLKPLVYSTGVACIFILVGTMVRGPYLTLVYS